MGCLDESIVLLQVTHHYPILTPYVEKIKMHTGREWFMVADLPEELRSTQKIIRAHNAGLVVQKKGKTPNGRRMRKVVL